MKKVLIGTFITESNENIPLKNEITSYDIEFGDDLIKKMTVKDIFDDAGIEIIPSIYAVSGAAGVTKKHTFDYIESCFVETVKEHLNEIDGIYLMLHGASYVDGGIGSGDHHILKTIRELVGPYVPIAVSCDPHGNLTKDYVNSIQIIRSYRESPHVDAVNTKQYTIQLLINLINSRQNIHAVYRKLPLILGGEQSVSLDEPVKSINKYMDKLEKDPRIMSMSWHVGYLRHDCPEAGCGIVVVPTTEKDQSYAEIIADDLVKYIWNKRSEFHYTGKTAELDDAVNMALNCVGKPFVLTDSGDNTTSGAPGWNTYVLRQFIESNNLKKKIIFGSIKDENTFNQLKQIKDGEITDICLGVNRDNLTNSIFLKVVRGKEADIILVHGEKIIGTLGQGILVHVLDKNIDIIVSNKTARMTNTINFQQFDIDWTNYDVVVLKQGYIFPDFKEKAYDYVMSLTDGATLQDTKKIPFKLIMRPMYPIDEI